MMSQQPVHGRRVMPLAGMIALSVLVAGCNSARFDGPASPGAPMVSAAPLPAPMQAPAVAVSSFDLVGDWGLASYHRTEDVERTQREAKNACRNPYVIASGPSGGIMMHLPDQTQVSEVFVKTGSGGQVYIGPQGPAGTQQDRLVLSFANNVLTTEWVDANVRSRYGTMVLSRC
jgi:hypothetical protein